VLEVVATAHTWRGGDGPYTIAPVVGLVLTLFLIRAAVRVPLGPAVVGVSVALGALFATIGATWGYTTALTGWAFAAAFGAASRRALRRNDSD